MPVYCLDLTAHNTLARQRGIGRYGYYLARALHDLRGELGPDEKLIAAVRCRGEVFTSDLRPDAHEEPLPPVAEQGAHYARYFWARRLFLRRALVARAPDVVHFLEGPQILPSDAYRSVVTCHDLIPLIFPSQYLPVPWRDEPIRRAREYLQYHRADRIISVSHATARDLLREIGVPEGRVTVIHHGIDHDTFHPRAREGEHDDLTRRLGVPRRYALYLGAHDRRKRVPLLLSAYASVFRETGVPLVLVGAWGKLPEDLRPALRDMPDGAVRLLGAVDAADLPALYRSADLHVLPSVYEGFGLTVLEAMASGCPVVTTRGGSLPEVGGDAVAYVTEDSLSELEETLLAVLTDEPRRDAMRKKGIAQASTFTWERCARATLATYRRAAGRAESLEPAHPHAPPTREPHPSPLPAPKSSAACP